MGHDDDRPPHLAVPGGESEESLLLQAEGDEAADADLERPGDAGGELEVREVGGEAGAEHGVAALTVQDLVQLGLRQPNLSEKSVRFYDELITG